MLIESWVAVMIVAGVFTIGFISTIGWILEGERRSQDREEIKILQRENKELRTRLAHKAALDNIKVANDYYNKEN